MVTRDAIAALYRSINTAYRPYAEGDFAKWQTLTAETVEALVRQSEVAMAVERSWRRASGVIGCLWGTRGEPPWGFVTCAGCQTAAGVPEGATRATEGPKQAQGEQTEILL